MFNTLLEIPMFHGISYEKLSKIIGEHPLQFHKYTDNETIISAGDESKHLIAVISGKVKVSISNQDELFKIIYTLEAPETLSADFLFGRDTHHPSTVTAVGECGIMKINKNDYIKIINSDRICLLNYLNMLSLNAQHTTRGLISLTSGELRKRIAYWVTTLTRNHSTDITIECKIRNLYTILGVHRQALTSTLSQMQEEGLIKFSATEIKVIDRRAMLTLLEKQP